MNIKRKKHLIIPQEYLTQISGNNRKRISVVITDPRSRHLILTREPQRHKVWQETTIRREQDFIPTPVLQAAKIDKNKNFSLTMKEGDLIIRRAK